MNVIDERFADIQLLRYELKGFSELSLRQKLYIYYLSEATLWGRDITFDQHCYCNLDIRQMLEAIYRHNATLSENEEGRALLTYLKQVWFASGIHHHYGCQKFIPHFSPTFMETCLQQVPQNELPLKEGEDIHDFIARMQHVIFDTDSLSKRVNLTKGEDLILTSACHFYEGVTQQEVESFYESMREQHTVHSEADQQQRQPSWGLNSTLVKQGNVIKEETWHINGRYGKTIQHIVNCLLLAKTYAENDGQQHIIDLLIDYYHTGDLSRFDDYSIAWTQHTEGSIDFINGFIEVYGDPLGIKGTWEGIVHYIDREATLRTTIIANHAQWFEDHSPVNDRFKKKQVTGISANVVRAAMLGGEEYPATAIGINLPNADWIRAVYGSKSISISNIVDAYNTASHGNGFYEEFVPDSETRQLIDQYGDLCDRLHTDLHECVGHGSGQLLSGIDNNALKAYASTIEEARADLFGLYYMADREMLSMQLLPHSDAYKAHYYTYLLNGLMTQLVRIEPGHNIEESHMRNRALIARWLMEHSNGNITLEKKEGKTFLRVYDYDKMRADIALLLAEIQRIKSEGDCEAAQQLVETYAINIDPLLHEEVLQRYSHLDIAPFKGFINPRLTLQYDEKGDIIDVQVDYTETYCEQMMRYSQQYSILAT